MNTQKQSLLSQFDPLNLDFIQKIGQGVCSTTWKIIDKDSNKPYSLKIIQNSITSKKISPLSERLRQAQSHSHENLIQHFYFYSDIKNLYQVNELVEGTTLFQILFEKKSFSEPESFSYLIQIINALEYLHQKTPPFYHGDIRLENILISKTGKLKLSCFGCANFLSNDSASENQDFWNLGVLLYEMLCGCTTFSQNEKKHFFQDFSNKKISKALSSECRDFLKILIKKSGVLTIDQIKKHDWVVHKGLCEETILEESVVLECTDSVFSTNFTEFIQTRESCVEFKEELESETEKLQTLEFKLANINSEKTELEKNEEAVRKKLIEAEFELEQLNSIDTSQELLESFNKAQKEYFLKTETWKKQKIHLEKLKKVLEVQNKQFEEKEKQLRSLSDSVKSLNIGISKVKSHRSLDLSSLKLNLDVLQFKIGEKSLQSFDSGYSLQDLKELVQVRADSIKFLSKSDYKEMILQVSSKSSDIQQKIADLKLSYELEKGRITQKTHKIKEKLNLSIKKKKEEQLKARLISQEVQKKKLYDLLKSAPRLDTEVQDNISKARSRLSLIKSSLSIVYLQVKSKLKEKFYLERQIDSKQLEIDDLKFELYDHQRKVSVVNIANLT